MVGGFFPPRCRPQCYLCACASSRSQIEGARMRLRARRHRGSIHLPASQKGPLSRVPALHRPPQAQNEGALTPSPCLGGFAFSMFQRRPQRRPRPPEYTVVACLARWSRSPQLRRDVGTGAGVSPRTKRTT